MSKLYDMYVKLKKQNSETIYLFKSGIFFLAIHNDAYLLSKIFKLKIGNLTDSIAKCGFPCSSLDKYVTLFKAHNLTIKIIETDKNIIYNFKEYMQNTDIAKLLELISSVDINNLSITEAYCFIENLKNEVHNIKGDKLWKEKVIYIMNYTSLKI